MNIRERDVILAIIWRKLRHTCLNQVKTWYFQALLFWNFFLSVHYHHLPIKIWLISNSCEFFLSKVLQFLCSLHSSTVMILFISYQLRHCIPLDFHRCFRGWRLVSTSVSSIYCPRHRTTYWKSWRMMQKLNAVAGLILRNIFLLERSTKLTPHTISFKTFWKEVPKDVWGLKTNMQPPIMISTVSRCSL